MLYILFSNNTIFLQLNEILELTWIGIFTLATAFTSWALEKGDTAKISNLAYIAPFLSLIWTALILKESFNSYSIFGLIAIVLGIFIQIKDKKENMSTINKQS